MNTFLFAVNAVDSSGVLFLNQVVSQSLWADTFLVFIATYLPVLLVLGFALFLFRSSTYAAKEKWLALLYALVAALIARIGFTNLIRYFFPRERPFVVLDVYDLFTISSSSFPSGHAAFFYAFSTVVYFYNRKLGVLFLLLTTLVCIVRVAAGLHYPTDILGGCVVGVFSGLLTHYCLKAPLNRVFNSKK